MRRFGVILAASVLFALASAARAAVEAVIDCDAIPGGVANPTINISFQLLPTPDCPGGVPPIRGMVVNSADVPPLTSPMTAAAKAACIVAAINSDPGNIRCTGDAVGTGVVASIGDGPFGAGTRVNISPAGVNDHLASLQVNDNTQSGGSLKGTDGTAKKDLTVSGAVAAGGTVTVTINPVVTVQTTPGQSPASVVQAISAALTAAGFSHTVVSVPASGLLQGGDPPAPTIQNTLAIVAQGHPSGEDGLWVLSTDPGLRGVKQVDLRPQGVPTTPQWGLIVLITAVLASGTVLIIRRRVRVPDGAPA